MLFSGDGALQGCRLYLARGFGSRHWASLGVCERTHPGISTRCLPHQRTTHHIQTGHAKRPAGSAIARSASNATCALCVHARALPGRVAMPSLPFSGLPQAHTCTDRTYHLSFLCITHCVSCGVSALRREGCSRILSPHTDAAHSRKRTWFLESRKSVCSRPHAACRTLTPCQAIDTSPTTGLRPKTPAARSKNLSCAPTAQHPPTSTHLPREGMHALREEAKRNVFHAQLPFDAPAAREHLAVLPGSLNTAV